MHLVVIFGPPAVGKMTVGRELAELTGLKLFHNHMTIEPVLDIFEFGSPPFTRLVRSFREQIVQEVAASDLPGLIFTCMWILDDPHDRRFIEDLVGTFESVGAAVHFVELAAPLDERIRRNRHPHRLLEKRSKRDVEASEERLIRNSTTLKLNTDGDFFRPEDHILIDNTARSPREVAGMIVERFGIEGVGDTGSG